MDISVPKPRRMRFGLFEADSEQRILTKNGLRVRLQEQPFQVLALLLDRPGEIVSREEIRQKLWPADTFVEFDDGLNTAIKKLRAALGDSADNPRFIETVPRRGYRFLAPISSPADPPKAIRPDDVAPTDLVIATREQARVVIEKRSASPVLFWSAVGLVLGAVAATGFFYRSTRGPAGARSRSEISLPAIKIRPAVAVMGFRNLSHDPDETWVSTALSEMLNTELAAGHQLRMIPGEQISRSKLDLALADTEALAKESLARVRADIGADYVVLGSYTSVGEKGKKRLRVDLRLQDTRDGETIAEEAVDGPHDQLFDLISDAGTRLRQRLQAGPVAAEQSVQVRASFPSNVQAARLYAEGLAKYRIFDAMAARDLYVKAISADPKFPMAHTALASAWAALGYDAKSKQEAKVAFDLSAELSSEEKLAAEGRYRQANLEWPRALEIYSTLSRTFADNLDYGLLFAFVQSSAGKGQEALATLASLRRLPLEASSDPRIDLEESRAAEMMGDFRHSQEAAARAESKGRAQGLRLIVAQALSDQGWDWDRLGEYEKAAQALNEARNLFAAAGDHRSTALAINLIGDMLYDKGDFDAATATLNQSLAMCRKHGFQTCASRSLNAIGHIQKDRGQLQLALKSYEEVLRVDRESGVRAGEAAALSNIGNVLQDLGDTQGARHKQEEALQVFTEIGDKRGMAATLGNLGNLLDDLGELQQAVHCYERGLELDQETGYKRGFGFVLAGWGRVLTEQDKLTEARSKLEESLKIRKEIGNPDMIGDTLLALAQLTLAEGRAAESAKLAEDAVSQFESVKSPDDEATANAALAKSLVVEQKIPEARVAADRALAHKGSDFQQHFDAIVAGALVEAASGKTADADKKLEAAQLQARKLNFNGDELEARLELGKIRIKSEGTQVAKVQLASLERDAKAKGYFLIARDAATALNQSVTIR